VVAKDAESSGRKRQPATELRSSFDVISISHLFMSTVWIVNK
jgi:hypothetical protein